MTTTKKKPTAVKLTANAKATKPAAAKKPAAKKATVAAKAVTTKKPAAKKAAPAAKKATVVKKPATAAAKTPTKKPAATVTSKAPAKKPVVKKPVVKKAVVKSPVAKKPAAPKKAASKPVTKVAAPKKAPAKKVAAAKPVAPAVSTKEPRWVITSRSVVLVVDGKNLMMDNSHKDFNKAVELVRAKKWDDAINLIRPLKVVEELVKSFNTQGVAVTVNGVTVDGVPLSGRLGDRLRQSLTNKDSSALEALANFARRCLKNPSFRVVNRVYDFLEANDIRIASDGRFLAWKLVRADYKDIHSGTMDNKVGMIVEMPRNQVQDDDRITCSNGLHVCSASYMKSFGNDSSRVMIVAVDPVDVVSVPTDYHDSKMRTCRYEVLKDCGPRGSFRVEDHR